MTTTNKVIPPSKLAHVVLRTNKFKEQREFYKTFLGGYEVHGTDFLTFITYDDEHHRIALFNDPSTRNKDYKTCGLEHIAFTFDSLKDLCTAYRQRKALGIEPGWCVNHGPTTSMYYRDMDGNMLETQADNFDDPEEATKYMLTPEFAENAAGTDFDPEELCEAVIDRGEDELKYKRPMPSGPRDHRDIEVIMERIKAKVPSVKVE
ncbi:Glyoxalase/Bleomycin resistance protein/Dihydroxybiphenyl dioxygenase [Marasmius fiardii PR-910]|nr:Glyoxalase/Bleomycin resistance protein/Dihydroxybiphenyl dioxygenase [Marasmius fiardii PR-910]